MSISCAVVVSWLLPSAFCQWFSSLSSMALCASVYSPREEITLPASQVIVGHKQRLEVDNLLSSSLCGKSLVNTNHDDHHHYLYYCHCFPH